MSYGMRHIVDLSMSFTDFYISTMWYHIIPIGFKNMNFRFTKPYVFITVYVLFNFLQVIIYIC